MVSYDAFIAAAESGSRKPVTLMAIESIDAIKVGISIKSDWDSYKTIDSLDTASMPGVIKPFDPYPLTVETFYTGGSPYSNINYVCWKNPPRDLTVLRIDKVQPNTMWVGEIHIVISDFRPTPHDIQVCETLPFGYTDLGTCAYDITGNGYWTVPSIVIPAGKWVSLWQYGYISIPYNASMWQELYGYPGSASYKLDLLLRHTPAASTRTKTVDLGVIPSEPSVFGCDYIAPSGSTVTYSARGSNDLLEWSELDVVHDKSSLSAFRYYDFYIVFTSDGVGIPSVSEITVSGGNSQFEYFSDQKDIPRRGARPYLKSLSPLTSKIDLLKSATTGEINATLFWRKKVGDMISRGYLKNKTVSFKLGYAGMAESEFVPYFTGTWFDYSADPSTQEISIKIRDVWKKFKQKVPEDTYSADGTKTTYLKLSGNIIQVMLQIINLTNAPDRYIDRDTFNSIRDTSRAGAAWVVSRELHESTEAAELLNELAISAGAFLFQLPDGRLTIRLYDDAVSATDVPVLDADRITFSAIDGGQKNLITRQAVYYQLIPGKTGTSTEDYAKGFLNPNQAAEIAWQETQTCEWLDKWGLGGGSDTEALNMLAQRRDSWFSNPRFTIRAENCPPRYIGIEKGDVVAVNSLELPTTDTNYDAGLRYTDQKLFLVLGKTVNPKTFTSSFDLFEVGPTTFTTSDIPAYTIFDRFPSVLNLRVNECVVQRSTGTVDHILIVQFDGPIDFVYGSAEIWIRVNDEAWTFFAPAPFTTPGGAYWIEIPCTVGYTYQIKAVTVNSGGFKQSLDLAPTTSITSTGVSTAIYMPPKDPTGSTTPPDRELPGININPPASPNSFPAIRGLRLTGQGNDTSFVGKHVSFSWNRYSFTYSLGAATGPAAGPPDSALVSYTAIIWNADGSLRHRAPGLKTEQYIYPFEQNYNDGSGIAARSLRGEVFAVGVKGDSKSATIDVSNPAPPIPDGIRLEAGLKSFTADWQPLSVPDLAGYKVWISTEAGFTPSESSVYARVQSTHLVVNNLPARTYFFRVAGYDTFGEDGLLISPEYAVTVYGAQILPDDLFTTLRADFMVLDSIFYFGDNGAHPTPGTETTLFWTAGRIIRGGSSFTLDGGSLMYASNKWVIATLVLGAASLSLAACGSGLPNLEPNQVIIASTSSVPNSAGNYLCYVRQANSALLEGAIIRDLTVTNEHVKDLSADKIKTGTMESTDYVPGVSGWKLGLNGTAEFRVVDIIDDLNIRSGAVSIGSVSGDTYPSLFPSVLAGGGQSTIASTSITVPAAYSALPFLVNFSFVIPCSSSAQIVAWDIYRGATHLDGDIVPNPGSGNLYRFTWSIVDSPGVGSFTYYLKLTIAGVTGTYSGHCALSVMGFKK